MTLNLANMLLTEEESKAPECGSPDCNESVCWTQLALQRDKTLRAVVEWLETEYAEAHEVSSHSANVVTVLAMRFKDALEAARVV